MSNPGGRPRGSKNQPGHTAGGSRPGAGRPEAKKRRTDSPIPKIHAAASSSKSASVTSPANIEGNNLISGSGPQDRIYSMFGGSSQNLKQPNKRARFMDVYSDTSANEQDVASTSEEMQTQFVNHPEYIVPDISALDSPDDEDSSNFDDDELLQEDPDGLPSKESEADTPISGIVQTYFLELKERLSREITLHKIPLCYQQGHFWIHPIEPYFAHAHSTTLPRWIGTISPLSTHCISVAPSSTG